MVSSPDAVNFHSLNLVRDELVATIEEAAQKLERFVSNEDGDALQTTIDCVGQIGGILSLIEFRGAELLAKELLASTNELASARSGPKYDRTLEVVSSTFFVLSRYLEYVQQTERKIPVLLIPQINELRKLRGEATLPECHFFSFNLSKPPPLPKLDPIAEGAEPLDSAMRRIRQMYQIGLLGIIKNKQIRNSIALMRRAMKRLRRYGGNDKPLSLLWYLTDVALEAMLAEKMEFIETRKVLFGRLDRVLRQVVKSGAVALESEPPKGLVKELVYLIILSTADNEDTKAIRLAYELESFGFTEQELASERDLLNGPSAQTVSSLANVLQAELANTKKVLEGASQSSIQKIDDLDSFVAALQKVAEILSIVGLVSASNTLKNELKRIESWRKMDTVDQVEMDEVANTLLYLESTIAAIETTKLSDEKLEMANRVAQREIIASGELAEAKRIVLTESEAGITLAKRALSSFSETDFDTGHIRNIAKTLNSIRGGMQILGFDRAASILRRCSLFVDQVLMEQELPPGIKEILETFADVIISVEYYFNSRSSSLHMDESVLQLAEESLEALGYPEGMTDDDDPDDDMV